jgi:hypothetical protein
MRWGDSTVEGRSGASFGPVKRGVRLAARGAAGLALVAGACLAPAQIMRFAQDMPIASMTREDLGMFETTLFGAMDSTPDGETRRWANPSTQAHGDVTPLSTFTQDGLRCRMAEVGNAAGGRQSRSTYRLCKTADGWRIFSN